KRNATTIFLEPLSEPESERLLQNLLYGVAGREVLGRIQEAAEGIPLFVEEMVSMLIDEGLVRREDGGWTAVRHLARVEGPASIQILLASRLDQLDSDERQVIERAAVEGTVFHRGATTALAGELSPASIDGCLLSLIRKELIRPTAAVVPGEEAFRFRHALIRDAAYEALPKRVRADLHERFAAWLEERVGEGDGFTGYHLEQAYRHRAELERVGEPERALALRAGTRLASAGRRALAHGDAPAAVKLLDRARAMLEVADAGSPDLLLDLGAAMNESGAFADADVVLGEAIADAERRRDRTLAESARIERARVLAQLDTEYDFSEAPQ